MTAKRYSYETLNISDTFESNHFEIVGTKTSPGIYQNLSKRLSFELNSSELIYITHFYTGKDLDQIYRRLVPNIRPEYVNGKSVIICISQSKYIGELMVEITVTNFVAFEA